MSRRPKIDWSAVRGRKRSGDMNQLEAAYAATLRLSRHPTILYEQLKFKLAPRTWFTPDFVIITEGGDLEAHEVKGFMQDDAAVKLKVLADQYPWLVVRLVRKRKARDGGGWSIDIVHPGPDHTLRA